MLDMDMGFCPIDLNQGYLSLSVYTFTLISHHIKQTDDGKHAIQRFLQSFSPKTLRVMMDISTKHARH